MSEIDPLNDSVRAELDAWDEYRGQLDAPAHVKVQWREAMRALEFDEPALAQWRSAIERGWR